MNIIQDHDENSVDIDETNAQKCLIETSMQKPVVVLFWSEQQQAGLALDKLLTQKSSDYAGDFLLARVNVDTQAMIAGQLGIQSLPTVMLIKNGQPVNAFQGEKNEQEVSEFLSEYLPKPYEKQLVLAREHIEHQAWDSALELLEVAYEASKQRADIALELAKVQLALHRIDQAENTLGTIKLADQNATYEHLMAEIDLQRESAKTPEIEALEKSLAKTPNDLDVQMQLAIQYHQSHMNKEACELLMSVLRTDKDFSDGKARKVLLDIFKAIGFKDPLVIEYQKQLFSILY